MKVKQVLICCGLLIALIQSANLLKADDIPPVRGSRDERIEDLQVERERLERRARILSDNLSRKLFQDDYLGYRKEVEELEATEKRIREIDELIGKPSKK